MNIFDRASWLANDFRKGLDLKLNDLGLWSMAAVLRVHFRQVAKSAKQKNNQDLLDKLEKLNDEVMEEYNRSVKDYTAGFSHGLLEAIKIIRADQ